MLLDRYVRTLPEGTVEAIRRSRLRPIRRNIIMTAELDEEQKSDIANEVDEMPPIDLDQEMELLQQPIIDMTTQLAYAYDETEVPKELLKPVVPN